MPDLDVTGRQHMLNQAGEQLLAGQGGGLVVPGPERHPVLVHGEEALVGEPGAMRVPTEVADHLLATAEGSLRVDARPGRRLDAGGMFVTATGAAAA